MYKIQPPKYQEGEAVRNLTVITYYGHEHRKRDAKRHWYRVRCTVCGLERDMPQNMLARGSICPGHEHRQKRRGGSKKTNRVPYVIW